MKNDYFDIIISFYLIYSLSDILGFHICFCSFCSGLGFSFFLSKPWLGTLLVLGVVDGDAQGVVDIGGQLSGSGQNLNKNKGKE